MTSSDRRIYRIEKWLKELYAEAEKDMRVKWDEHLARQEKRAERLLSRIAEAKTAEAKATAEAKYKDFLKNRVFAEKYYKDMVDEMARQYADAGRRAAEIVNGERYEAFADGYNLSAGEINRVAIDKDIGIRFDMCDAGTIEELEKYSGDLMLPPKADPSKVDLTVWNVRSINAQVAQGIVQGESIPKIAERLSNVTHMNEVAAVRTARTMTTAAENAGRVQNMKIAENWGVKTRKQWMCTLDSRTRDSHLALDGETVDNDAEFSNKCRYPGDPLGPAKEVYNCRCTLVSVVGGFSSNLPEGKQDAVHVWIDGEELERGKRYLVTPKNEREGMARKILEERQKQREERKQKREERQKEKQAAAEQLTGWDKVRALRAAKPASEMSSAELKEIGRAFYDSDEYRSRMDVGADEIASLRESKEAAYNAVVRARDEYNSHPSSAGMEEWQKKYDEYMMADAHLNGSMQRVKMLNSEMIADVRGEERGFSSDKQKTAHLGRTTDARKAVADGYGRYPASWVRASVDRGSLNVKKVDRGFYRDWDSTLNVSGNDYNAMRNTAVHEIGHRMEKVMKLTDAERQFYKERTEGESLEWMGPGYGREEKTRKDDFVNAYMGKDYGGSAYELVSMGFEGVIGYTARVDLSKDEDMRDWITGILLSY